MPSLPVLSISDGTTSINLIDPRNGFLLKDWLPARPVMNQTRRNSLFSGGSAVRMYTYGDVIDTFTVAARNVEQDTLIANCQGLDQLLTKAVDYWATSWATTPVWIEAKGPNETNTRYAIIKSYQVAGEGNPYAQPFFGVFCTAGHEELTIAIEHGIWRSTPPLMSTGIAVTSQQAFGGITYGRNATNPTVGGALVDEWFVANKHNLANIMHVYHYDASGPAWSANLIGAVKPVALLPAAIANLDILYIGCDSTFTNSGPFNNVIFDVNPVATYVAAAHFHWEYYNGAWVSLTLHDGTYHPEYVDATHPFSYLGVCNISFVQPADWTTVLINGVTGYWVRAVAQIGGGDSVTTPSQQNRDIYSCTWPYVDIAGSNVQGDMPALLRMRIHCRSVASAATNEIPAEPTRVYVSSRSLSRGIHFTPYINWSSEQNGPGFGVGTSSADTTDVASMLQASGRCFRYAPAGLKAMTLEMTAGFFAGGGPIGLSNEYRGKYLVFLRYALAAGAAAGDIKVQLGIYTSTGSQKLGPVFSLTNNTVPTLLNMGRISYPLGSFAPTTQVIGDGFGLYVQNVPAAARTVYFLDLILMPCDEWFGIFEDSQNYMSANTYPMSERTILVVDSAQYPKESPYASHEHCLDRIAWSDQDMQRYIAYSAGDAILQANVDQRLWFLFEGPSAYNTLPRYPYISILASIRCQIAQRYQSMRGAR